MRRILFLIALFMSSVSVAEEDSAAANIGAANQAQGSTAAR